MLNKTALVLLLVISLVAILLVSFPSCQKHKAEADKTLSKTAPEPAYQEPENSKPGAAQPGQESLLQYPYRWDKTQDYPPVAIVIDDFGIISGKLLQGFLDTDEEVTFSVLPDLSHTSETARQANIHGHEVILHIPMEALDASQNPGKVFISSHLDEGEVKILLTGFLNQVPQAIGANNHMGSRVTSELETMSYVMKVLDKQGLFFLDSRTNADSKAYQAAAQEGMDYASRDMFLDVPDVSPATIASKIKQLDRFKGRLEPVIVISHCHNQAKLEALRSFISQLKEKNIRLIPLSEAVTRFRTAA